MNRVTLWRKENPEKRKEQKRKEKLKKRLRDLSVLPKPNQPLNDEQKKIIEDINDGTFIMPKKWTEINLSKNQKLNKDELIKYEKIFDLKQSKEFQILKRAEKNAQNKKLKFNLTIDDIIIPEKCPYLDVPFDNKRHKLSIDRIDSSKGYEKNNIQIISLMANKMKQDSTLDELLKFAKNILKIHKKI